MPDERERSGQSRDRGRGSERRGDRSREEEQEALARRIRHFLRGGSGGSTGEAVNDVQRVLGVTASGTFDAATEAAVRQFQRNHGLVPDGIVGPRTWATLLE